MAPADGGLLGPRAAMNRETCVSISSASISSILRVPQRAPESMKACLSRQA
jgi:hypothetical protein